MKVNYKGKAKPDDPVYKSGFWIGGRRFGSLIKNIPKDTEDKKKQDGPQSENND